MSIVLYYFCLVVGVALGFFLASLCQAASKADEGTYRHRHDPINTLHDYGQ